MSSRSAGWRALSGRALAIVLGAVGLCWPALWSGYPLLNVDCITYLASGRRVIDLLLGDHSLSTAYLRSEIYCATIYLLHWNWSAWPIIAVDALLTAWTLWLVVRVLVQVHPMRFYAALLVVLCVSTTASWSVSDLLPDSLGAVLYLSLYLLVFARESLRRWEVVTLSVVACWCVTTHTTYLPIALVLCVGLALAAVLRWAPMRGRGRWLVQATALVLLAAAAELGVNDRIFGKPSLLGPHLPQLMARIIADGPSHDYLRANCATLHWVICDSVDHLPWSEGDFLWPPNGIYANATPAQQQALNDEEMPLVINTLRAYPLQQARASLRNVVAQLSTFSIDPVGQDNPWMISMFDLVIPGSKAKYLREHQREASLHRPLFGAIQRVVVKVSAALVLLLAYALWRSRKGLDSSRLLTLAVVVLYVLLANAAITGALSGVSARYQGRVVWLLPMLALLMLNQYAAERMRWSPAAAARRRIVG